MQISSEAQVKAEQLAKDANALLKTGDLASAARTLKQAASIAPESALVKSTWTALQEEEAKSPLQRLCKSWVEHQREQDAQDALKYMASNKLPKDVAEETLNYLLESKHPKEQVAEDDAFEEEDFGDQLIGALLRHPGARTTLASQFSRYPMITFEKVWRHGDDSMDGLVAVMLDSSSWPSERERVAAQRDVFQLALAKLMEAGMDYPERAMKAIARLLAAEAENLNGIIDYDSFDAILNCFDIRLPNTLRSHATLATSKLLELAPENAQTLITQFVKTKITKPTSENLIKGFSAAAAVFPMSPSVAAALFLTPGFVEGLVPLVEQKKSQKVEQAALELLSSACLDKSCREAITKHCKTWLQGIAQSGTDKRRSSLAALILTKISEAPAPGQKSRSNEEDSSADMVGKFKNMVISSEQNTKQDSIEGLAYASLRPTVKEDLANDAAFLKNLIKSLIDPNSGKASLYGGLTILANLTTYLPVLSEEQKRISQLKAYANTSKPAETDPLDDDAHVTARCKKVLDAGVVPMLVTCSKGASPTVLSLVAQVLLSLSKNQRHRGLMAQQGAVKLLLQTYDTLTPQTATSTATEKISPTRTAAHALARILISVNPLHVFSASASPQLTSAIRPLLSLLEDDPSSEQRDLLPVFESLLALTNLASTDDSARDTIIRLAWPRLEDLLLSNNTLVQRATVELVCNLMASPQGVAKFADGTKQAGNRLHILLALADVDDLATRRAAGGALAMLTEWDAAADAVVKRDRGVKILLGLCEEDNEELVHRGVACIRNLVCAPGDVGNRGKEKVKAENGVEILRNALTRSKTRDVLQLGVEALKALS